jgi:hypothetical protein
LAHAAKGVKKKSIALLCRVWHVSVMNTAQDIVDAIGVQEICAAMDVSEGAVKKAIAKNKLPAMWFGFCEQRIPSPLPRHLFSFKGMCYEK